jgi:hypothetical protein
MEENQVGGGKGAQAGERRQPGFARRAGSQFGSQIGSQFGSQIGSQFGSQCGLRLRGWIFGPVTRGSRRDALGQAVTSEPTFSPWITRRMLPGWFMLKMIMGRLLSLHMLTAVASITFNPSFRISM